jgi:DNA mismatch endonuclease (patch repair protein)
MRANRSRDTGPELALRRALHARGLRYRVEAALEPGVRCRADVVFRPQRVAVFMDGCFWHRCPLHATDPANNAEYWRAKFERVVARDRRNDVALTDAGWTVVRVWEHEDPAEAADRIEALVQAAPGLCREVTAAPR